MYWGSLNNESFIIDINKQYDQGRERQYFLLFGLVVSYYNCGRGYLWNS